MLVTLWPWQHYDGEEKHTATAETAAHHPCRGMLSVWWTARPDDTQQQKTDATSMGGA